MKQKAMAIFLMVILFPFLAEGKETRVVVRAKSKDAKFIGTSMGGALVQIRDSETGAILAKGFTSGGTGDTNKIMVEPWKRGTALSNESTAGFETVVDIEEPVLATIEVKAPYAQRQSMITASTQVWLIPGKDLVGDGILVEIPGFAVDILSPQAHEGIQLVGSNVSVSVRINLVMM